MVKTVCLYLVRIDHASKDTNLCFVKIDPAFRCMNVGNGIKLVVLLNTVVACSVHD